MIKYLLPIKKHNNKNQKSATIDMSSYSKGIYFVRIEDENKNMMNRKIVLQ